MGEFTTIMARDGHEFQAYLAAPTGKPRGAIVVLQEIFGVNSHIRAVTDSFASEGYTAIAPSLFDRVRRGIQLGYGPEDISLAAAVSLGNLAGGCTDTIPSANPGTSPTSRGAARSTAWGTRGSATASIPAWRSVAT